jgi:hypothetical protein
MSAASRPKAHERTCVQPARPRAQFDYAHSVQHPFVDRAPAALGRQSTAQMFEFGLESCAATERR